MKLVVCCKPSVVVDEEEIFQTARITDRTGDLELVSIRIEKLGNDEHG